MWKVTNCLLAAVGLVVPSVTQAADLKIAVAAETQSIDPHYASVQTNNSFLRNVYEPLVLTDAGGKMVPGLALSWRAVDDKTWEIELRPNVRFHDGSPFTAKDIVFTLDRIAKLPNSPTPYTQWTKPIVSTEPVGDFKIRLITDQPFPNLPRHLTQFYIASHIASANTTTEDMNAGKGAIGTGPYRFVKWTKGQAIDLTRFDGYWGGAEPWTNVTIRPIGNVGSRLAALLAGDVDLIERPSTADLERIRGDTRLALSSVMSLRMVYYHFDSFAEPSPGISGTEGRNPLKDARVRRAMSLAVDRKTIAERVMNGESVPAGQLIPAGFLGADPALTPQPYDPEAARRLLNEAGYPNGFDLVIATTSDRVSNDTRITQAVAGMFARVGIRATVESLPWTSYAPRMNAFGFSLYLSSWGSATNEASSGLRAILMTPNAERGDGVVNRGRYSNAAFDAALGEGMKTMDDSARDALLRKASRIAIEDQAFLPIHFENITWAHLRTISHEARTDQLTLASSVKPAR